MIFRLRNPSRASQNVPQISSSYEALEEIQATVQNNSRKAETGMYGRLT